jgi:glutamyl-tRNA reductase
MIGVSWRQDGSESLASFTLPEDGLDERLRRFASAEDLAELAYIATCNRVELVLCRRSGAPAADLRRAAFELLTGKRPAPGEAERRLKAWQGEGAAEHLFLIAAGLDSACVGETEVVGQVRASHERARAMGLSGTTLDLIFAEAQRIAGKVRGGTRLGQGRVSLAEIAVDEIRERIARTPGTTALIGVSPMTERAALSLATAGLAFVVVNRSPERAHALAEQYGAASLSLDAFRADPPAIEALLTATGADEAVLREPTLERLAARSPSGEAPLIVDMAIPPDVELEACAKLGLPRLGMDEIVAVAERNRAARLTEAAQAREQVDAALDQLQERLAERFYGPLLGALQRRYQRTAEEGVKRLLKKELKGLGDKEREAIETWARVLARRFAHIPCVGLRGLLYAGPDGSIEAFLSGLEPEFADELRAALGGAAASGEGQRGSAAPGGKGQRGAAASGGNGRHAEAGAADEDRSGAADPAAAPRQTGTAPGARAAAAGKRA